MQGIAPLPTSQMPWESRRRAVQELLGAAGDGTQAPKFPMIQLRRPGKTPSRRRAPWGPADAGGIEAREDPEIFFGVAWEPARDILGPHHWQAMGDHGVDAVHQVISRFDVFGSHCRSQVYSVTSEFVAGGLRAIRSSEARMATSFSPPAQQRSRSLWQPATTIF